MAEERLTLMSRVREVESSFSKGRPNRCSVANGSPPLQHLRR